ncbi:PREDICTED: NADH dehydrogenase (ubiquinone) complex I, assembly factor 6 [Ceratosolen solmsi marchali]|uniref:NADH dehydrogenase (Ubiquinone) complex I, assembly factor 6 n=1 Tax=Ceratosolen solmsi marchali TaxID=326594 RepID=A0AAJ6YXC0_9HYME|nr:PREDICTED: NADH dehydrogenase (ubiquinone) complex I, assembly factor 6 [Ceratosolen solmsi marchali]
MIIISLRKLLKSRYCQTRGLKVASAGQTPAEYCLHLVRNNDFENFLCTLILPKILRSTAFAIRAFNTEIATIQDQITDNRYGLLRIEFWTDTLNNIYNDKPIEHPTSLELYRVMHKKKLSKYYFKRLIESRSNHINSSTFTSLQSMENYAENSVSTIYYLLLEAGEIQDIKTDHFASHLGKAHGIVTLIRSVPHNTERRIINLPQDVLMKHGISSESVLQKKSTNKLKDVIYEISTKAKQHLNKALSLQNQIKNESRIIFLPYIFIKDYLDNLEKADFDVFHPKLQERNDLLVFKLLWKKLSLQINKSSRFN